MTRVDALSVSPYRRASFEFDTIDADTADAAGAQIGDLFQDARTKPFALLRIVTTPGRFRDFAGDVTTPGDWFFLKIEPRGLRPGLMTWHAQLGPAGYSSHSRGVTVEARRLTSEDDEPRRPRSLGAAVATRTVCQTALNIDPGSASKIDPSESCGATPLISPAKRVGVAQPG